MDFQEAGALVDCRAGGHDVIDEQQVQTGERGAALEDAAHIGGSVAVRQRGLRGAGPTTLARCDVERNAELLAEIAGYFDGLVEAAFTQTGGVQGHGNEAVKRFAAQRASDFVSKPRGQGEFASVLVGMHQTVQREGIAKNRRCGIKIGGMRQAPATAFAVRRRFGALWAAWRQARQVVSAGGTKDARAVGTAEQTGLRQAGTQESGDGDSPSFR